MFLMWLGEQITGRGIGNGISLIIFVGIVAEIPAALAQFFAQGPLGRAVDAGHPGHPGDGGGRHHLRRLHGTRAAQDPHPVSPPPGGHEDL
jgi:preprotein translocase subunit SecY